MERHTDDEARQRPDSSDKLNRGHRTVRTTVSTGSESNVVNIDADDKKEGSSSREVAETETDAEADTLSHDEAEAEADIASVSCLRSRSQPHDFSDAVDPGEFPENLHLHLHLGIHHLGSRF